MQCWIDLIEILNRRTYIQRKIYSSLRVYMKLKRENESLGGRAHMCDENTRKSKKVTSIKTQESGCIQEGQAECSRLGMACHPYLGCVIRCSLCTNFLSCKTFLLYVFLCF